jgi:SAM-dependent methyltransferase
LYEGQETAGNVSFRIRLARTIELLPKGPISVLDVGCGPAPLASRLSPGSRYTGVDLVEEMLRSARARVGGAILVRANASLPFRDASFDAVVALGFIEYLDDIPAALRELRRVVRAGGTVILSTPKRFHVDRLMVQAATPLRALAAAVWGRRSDTIRRTLLTPRELDGLAADALLRPTGGVHYHYLPLPYPLTMITPSLSLRATRLVEAWQGRQTLSPFAHGYLGRYERV